MISEELIHHAQHLQHAQKDEVSLWQITGAGEVVAGASELSEDTLRSVVSGGVVS